jgi:hypothetical protein
MKQTPLSSRAPCLAVMLAMGPTQAIAAATEESDFVVRAGERGADEGETVRQGPFEILSELKLDNGNVLRFIDESMDGGTPRIGVVEVAAPRSGSVLRALTREQPLTPLELYLALAPRGAAIPAPLLLHHQAAAKTTPGISSEPRVLTVEATAQAADVGWCYEESGALYHGEFLGLVVSEFGGPLPNHGHGHDLTSTHYGVTGTSSKRALGTCNVEGYVKSVGVEYQWSAALWVAVPLGVSWLFPGQSLFYYSDSGVQVPQKYRIKVGFTVEGNPSNRAHTEGSW